MRECDEEINIYDMILLQVLILFICLFCLLRFTFVGPWRKQKARSTTGIMCNGL
jgi:hypothetical protein